MPKKTPSIQQTITSFIHADPFNALFVYEAINRHVQYVMHLNPADHERSLVSLNLIQEIAQDWHNTTHTK